MLSSVSQYRPWCSTGSVFPAHCCSCKRDQRSMRPPSWVWRDTLSEYRPLGSFSLTALRHKTSTSMGCGVRVHSTYTERKSERNTSLCKKKKRFVESKRKKKNFTENNFTYIEHFILCYSLVLNIYTKFVNVCNLFQDLHFEICFGMEQIWME